MKFCDIVKNFEINGWDKRDVSDSSSYYTDWEFFKDYRKIYIQDVQGKGPCISWIRNTIDYVFIGEIESLEFGNDFLNVIFYNGTKWGIDFSNNAIEHFQIIKNFCSPKEKPKGWDEVDERPHYYEFEIVETNKCIVRAYAHSEEEAIKVIKSISDKEWEEYVDNRLEIAKPYEFVKIREDKTRILDEPQFSDPGYEDL